MKGSDPARDLWGGGDGPVVSVVRDGQWATHSGTEVLELEYDESGVLRVGVEGKLIDT